jgi:Trypsin/Bacterial pre-peptidase C-terminal domain
MTGTTRAAVRLIGSLLVSAALVPSAHSATADAHGARIVNGLATASHPSVGALLKGATSQTASAWCSGTLVGCETFLTAGHCVHGFNPSAFHVFIPSAGFFEVASIAVHPGFAFPDGDVAVLKLAAPVDGVAPSAINATAAPLFGSPGTIVGFGRSGDPNDDAGLKRAGAVTTVSCLPSGESDTDQVCWTFAAPLGPPGSNSNTCNGDSGGPLFVDLGCGEVIAGVTSGGAMASCLPPDESFDANVFAYRSFIEGIGGADLTATSCGTRPQAGEPGTTVLALEGALGAGQVDGRHQFQVDAGAALLRVAMSARDDGSSNFDLYVKAGVAPTLADFDCRQSGSNQYGLCELAVPTVGDWHVLVHRVTGAGPYQVTVTVFGDGVGGAGSPEEGQACDDRNPCTADDVCQESQCVGAAVAAGTPCDAANPCGDFCREGVCSGACKRPTRSRRASLVLRQDPKTDDRDRFTWRWASGAATTKDELGDPTGDTAFTLRVCREADSMPEVLLEQHVLPGLRLRRGPGWKERRRGFSYSDRRLLDGAIKGITLTAGRSGSARIAVDGKSGKLDLPGLPLSAGPLTVQLTNDRACWAATYSAPQRNTAVSFRAKGD